MLGPSDSGKTVYAFNELAWKGFHLPRDGESANQRLKMKAVPVYQTLNASDKYDPKTKFEEYIAQNVRGAINRALGEDRDGKLKLKMALSVFLDEAGARDEFMRDKEVLYGICQKLNGLADHVRFIQDSIIFPLTCRRQRKSSNTECSLGINPTFCLRLEKI